MKIFKLVISDRGHWNASNHLTKRPKKVSQQVCSTGQMLIMNITMCLEAHIHILYIEYNMYLYCMYISRIAYTYVCLPLRSGKS